MSTIRPTQTQSIKLQDSLEVCKEHLDLLTILARLLVRVGLGNVASDIACRFMDAARDLPSRCVRTTARLHRAGRAVSLSGVIENGAVFGDMGTLDPESAPLPAQHLALRAAIFVGLLVPLEIAAG